MRTLLVLVGVLVGLQFGPVTAEAARPKTHPYVRHFASRSLPSAEWTVPNLCKAYNFPTSVSGSGVIGILEFGGGWLQSDLDTFSGLFGLPKINVTNVSLDGTTNNPGVDINADAEVALDIQCAAASYYYATGKMPTIIVFFSNGDFIGTFNAAVAAKCDVLSISWGLDELSWQLQAPGYAQQVESAAQSATASGLVIFAASGDNSSSDGDTGTNVDMPASCPHIIGCGGTSKTTSSETVWGDGVSTDWGTGGGYSAIFPVQSFQINAPAPPAGLGRMVPDIAADADPNTGIIIVLQGNEILIGGTSAVAPLYAGLFAALGKKLGFITPTLWKNPSAFSDITSGSNGAYSAATGPDPCSGLGVAKGTSVAALFTSVVTPPPSNVVAINYNTVNHTITLTGDAGDNVLKISKSGTTLTFQTGGSTKLTASINSGSASAQTTGATLSPISGNVAITGNLADGNDSLSLTGLGISTITLALGNGNDTVSMTLCTVGTCAIDGGAGTDVFTTTGTKITKNQNKNIP